MFKHISKRTLIAFGSFWGHSSMIVALLVVLTMPSYLLSTWSQTAAMVSLTATFSLGLALFIWGGHVLRNPEMPSWKRLPPIIMSLAIGMLRSLLGWVVCFSIFLFGGVLMHVLPEFFHPTLTLCVLVACGFAIYVVRWRRYDQTLVTT